MQSSSAPAPVADTPEHRRSLRRALRAKRRALRPSQQRAASLRLCRKIALSPLFRQARRVALYIAADGEIDPRPLAAIALQQGKALYLPVLDRRSGNRLWFIRFRAGDRLRRNRYGIAEPRGLGPRVAPWQLDLVLMPLVGFDAAGNRLGMGGGYYDRTFAPMVGAPAGAMPKPWPRHPRLCGLAHRNQRVDRLLPAPWDVPMVRVFTD